MKLNKKKLSIVLPQIKAYQDVALLEDNPERPGLVDFIFQPKTTTLEIGCFNRLTCNISGGGGDGLFASTQDDCLSKPFKISIAKLRSALKITSADPELKDGVVNGIDIQVNADSIKDIGEENIRKFDLSKCIKFSMPRVDYELLANTLPVFVSRDFTRYFMRGYNIDFSKDEDFINFVATDGRKMAICKFPCKHPIEDVKEKSGFIFNPLHLFVPDSTYYRVQWLVNEFIALVQIQTEDYSIDCWARSIEGQFPNYIRSVPDREQTKEWISLSAKSTRTAFDSIKGLIHDDFRSAGPGVFLNAEDPKAIKLVVPGASVNIDGEASRPVCIHVAWGCLNPAFFNIPFTKFLFNSVDKAFFAEETRAARGTTMVVTKIFMPLAREDNTDEWGLVDLSKVSQEEPGDIELEIGDEDDEGYEDDAAAIEYGESSEDVF